jgi:hypothetical protein
MTIHGVAAIFKVLSANIIASADVGADTHLCCVRGIYLYLVAIPTYLKDPVEARQHAAVSTTVLIDSITSTRERNALVLQMA